MRDVWPTSMVLRPSLQRPVAVSHTHRLSNILHQLYVLTIAMMLIGTYSNRLSYLLLL